MPTPNAVLWTEDEDSIVRAGVLAGKTASQILEDLPNRGSRNAVIGRIARLGIERPIKAKVQKETPANWKKSRGVSMEERRLKAEQAFATRRAVEEANGQRRNIERETELRKQMESLAAKRDLSTIPDGQGKPIADLGRHECKWPLGPLWARASIFCAAPAMGPEAVYCVKHWLVSLAPERRAVVQAETLVKHGLVGVDDAAR